MKFEPYEEYKEVDLPWLDRVPSHWEVNRVKHIFDLVKEPSSNENPTVLSLTQKGIKIRDIESNEGQLAKSYEGYNTIKKGYICLNPMDLESGAAAKSEYEGVISNAYFTIKPKKNNINTNFYSKYFNLHYKKKIFYAFGKGVGRPEGSGGRWTLNRETFINFYIIFPPKKEQDKIVEFLDDKLEKIDRFIELREKQIELSREEKEILINAAVTRGIDKSVKYKDSGIDWIGKIPEHWEVIRLKNVVTNIESGVWGEEAKGNEEDLVCIRAADFNMINLKANELHLTIRNIDINKNKHRILKNGDLILEKSGGGDKQPVGRVIYFESEDLSVCSNFLAKFTPNEEILSRYLLYFLHNIQIRREHMSFINQTTGIQNLDMNKYFSNKILHPPIEEQKQIVAHIEKETSKIDKTIDLYKKQIDLIKEYRTSLISQAVTGKIDVRSF